MATDILLFCLTQEVLCGMEKRNQVSGMRPVHVTHGLVLITDLLLPLQQSLKVVLRLSLVVGLDGKQESRMTWLTLFEVVRIGRDLTVMRLFGWFSALTRA